MTVEPEGNAMDTHRPAGRTITLRLGLVALGLIAWFGTQSLIGARTAPDHGVGDGVFDALAPLHGWLLANTDAADGLLIASSLVIDALGGFLLVRAVFGPTIRPFLGLLMLFALRQACQGLVALPAPEGMIWRHPGFPSLLVTYGVANDLFFSGHTAIAVLGAVELARLKPVAARDWRRALPWIGLAIALFEAGTVVALRAHYTMDVFTGAVTALLAAEWSRRWAPWVDRKLG